MRIQNSKFKIQNILPVTRHLSLVTAFALFTFFLLFTSHFSLPTSALAADWGGVDESVVEKYAKEHGREAHEPLINTDQGDLLLFVFLLAGAVGGFIGGYYWRQLTESRAKNTEQKTQIRGA